MATMELRRNSMVELINEMGSVSFGRLKTQFPDVSEMTLRTDLKVLDEERRILRVHGGAKSIRTVMGDDGLLDQKALENIAEKEMIVEKALNLLSKDGVIFLDSGSTTTMFARRFPDQPGIVCTTGLSCAVELSRLRQTKIMIPGGELNPNSQSVCGHSAIRSLEQINFHQAFLGVTGYHSSVGFTSGISNEAMLKQAAIRQSEQIIMLMDSSKIGVKCSFNICNLSEADIIVSDGKLSEEFLSECRKYGVKVL
ncbi:MAG: DeoR/GlpR family DNA-binding transcription regulator [Clostridiales bacterium]|nr:DeoR/GlpR family DNA-binding transcription regulator [Clostridiales bacterium]